MKAEELMIGDWVHYRGTNIQVTSLYDKGGSNEIGWSDKESVWVNGSNVEPIPLTPEILEKIGFVTKDEPGNWTGYRMYSLHTEGKCFMLAFYEKYEMCEISLNAAPYWIRFKHLHELQHALKLCGINKEIVI